MIIEMYSDYRCGHCRQWSLETLPKLQDFIDSGKIRIEYNSMPVLGDESVLIAQASHAAALQNQFWEYHHELFANAPEAKPEALTELAGKIGMDTEKFAADLKDPETVKAVDTERSRGTSPESPEPRHSSLDTPSFQAPTQPTNSSESLTKNSNAQKTTSK